jgi:hypothetical protein
MDAIVVYSNQQEDQEFSNLSSLLDKYTELSSKLDKKLDEIRSKKQQQKK